MNYQLQSQTQKLNRYIPAKTQDFEKYDSRSTQRSSSGKKIIFIRRKVSHTSINFHNQPQKFNPQKSPNITTHYNLKPIDFQQTNNIQVKYSNNQNKESQNKLNCDNNHSKTYLSLEKQQNHTKKHPQQSVKISRGQFYEQQLENIQKDVQFFRFQLQLAQTKNIQLQTELSQKQQQTTMCIQKFYSEVARLFLDKTHKLLQSDQIFRQVSDKKYFSSLLTKSSDSKKQVLDLKGFQKDYIRILKLMNSSFQTISQLDQLVKSQEIIINKLMNEAQFLNSYNKKLQAQSIRLSQIVNLNNKNNILNSEVQNAQSVKQGDYTKFFNPQKKTADQKQLISKCKNAQVQTEQKRIGWAASIHKYKSYRFLNTPNNFRPYKNNLSLSKLESHSKQIQTPNVKTQQEVKQIATVKKINVQMIKEKRNNQKKTKKVNERKKQPATSSYINHLIQSQTLIKGDQTIQTIQTQTIQAHLPNQAANSKSQLSLRRPVHRSRSHSQQQITSSAQKSSIKRSSNNISSRVYSTYSLNPFNKYGQKRLCNEVNNKRIRKITQLSQQSQELSERMKELIEEQKILKEKYKELEKIKVSRQGKKSRNINNSIDNKNKQANYY